MKIFDFIKGLLPRLSKSSILEDLRISKSEVETMLIPNYRTASEHFRTVKISDPTNKALTTRFYSQFSGKGPKASNLVEEVYKRLSTVNENMTLVSSELEALLEKDILKEGLTAKKAVLIRAVSAFSLISQYSALLLNYIYVNEAINQNREVQESLRLSPAVMRNIDQGIVSFAKALSAYSVSPADLAKSLEGVPDIALNAKTQSAVMGVYQEADVDPLNRGHIVGFAYNPFYAYGKYRAEAEAARYKASKDKKKLLELRLLHLKLLSDGQNDPKLEQEIEYLQSRIDKVARYLEDIEANL